VSTAIVQRLRPGVSAVAQQVRSALGLAEEHRAERAGPNPFEYPLPLRAVAGQVDGQQREGIDPDGDREAGVRRAGELVEREQVRNGHA
jgi:hypothetical protein